MSARKVLCTVLTVLNIFAAESNSANIDRATITEVVNSVSVIDAGTRRGSPAKLQSEFAAPNVLRTGVDSRAELTAPDQTVARIGQNTLFSFQPNSRQIDLQRGSILFQSPTGKGGGTIRTPAASAAVLGTTLIVVTTKNGGFKVLLIEGKGSVRGADGSVRKLGPGEMVYALPGGRLSGVFEYRLAQQVGAAQLIRGFKKPLASAAKIEAAVAKQEKEIAGGDAVATNLLATGTPGVVVQVDVARSTIIDESKDDDTGNGTASSTDLIIGNPTLDSTTVFSPGDPGADVPTNFSFFDHFGVPHGEDELAQRPALLLGSNIVFDTPFVDFGPFSDRDLFQIIAINKISFEQSVDFGVFAGRELMLLAGGAFEAQPGTVVRADTNRLAFISLGSSYPLTGAAPQGLEDVGFDVPFALTDFAAVNTGGFLEFVGGDFDLKGVQLGARDEIAMVAARDFELSGSSGGAVIPSAPSPYSNGAPTVGARFSTLTSRAGIVIGAARDVNILRTEFRSPSTVIAAGDRLKLTAVQFNDGTRIVDFSEASPPNSFFLPRSVQLTAKNLIDLRGVNFFTNDVVMQSQTIRLEGVNFRRDSRVILTTPIGRLAANPNTGAPVVPGRVNFVRGVRFGGEDAVEFVRQNGPGQTPRGAGIFVRPINNVIRRGEVIGQ